jgi:hypothetical protein
MMQGLMQGVMPVAPTVLNDDEAQDLVRRIRPFVLDWVG